MRRFHECFYYEDIHGGTASKIKSAEHQCTVAVPGGMFNNKGRKMLDAAIAFDLLDELIEEGDKHRAAVTLGEYKSVLSNREYEEYKARIALMPVNVPTKGSVL